MIDEKRTEDMNIKKIRSCPSESLKLSSGCSDNVDETNPQKVVVV